MKNLKTIVEEVKSLRSKDFKPSDDVVLESSVMLFISQEEEVEKPKKSPQKNGKKTFKIKDPQSPATQPQKDKLDEMGIKYPKELTKGEAHQLISENSSKENYADY